MTDIIVEGAAAANLAIIAAIMRGDGTANWIVGKICPAVLAVLLGIHAYGKFMGWPV